jgi:hypothetical protein
MENKWPAMPNALQSIFYLKFIFHSKSEYNFYSRSLIVKKTKFRIIDWTHIFSVEGIRRSVQEKQK